MSWHDPMYSEDNYDITACRICMKQSYHSFFRFQTICVGIYLSKHTRKLICVRVWIIIPPYASLKNNDILTLGALTQFSEMWIKRRRLPLKGWGGNVFCEMVPSVFRLKLFMVYGILHIDLGEIAHLTHWGWDKMAAIFQTTFSNAFSWM